MLLYETEQRRLRHARADVVEAVAAGYGGCQSEKNARQMAQLLQALRA